MKKLLLSMAVVFITAFSVNAQTFSLEWDNETLGETITLTPEDTVAVEIVFHAIFKNGTDKGVNIKVARNQIDMMGESVSTFCWELCFPDFVDTSANSIYIPAGGYSELEAFSGHFEIRGSEGVSIIEYTFYKEENPEEKTSIVVKFDSSPTGLNETILRNINVSDIYPNPATTNVTIDYNLPLEVNNANIKIVNILGSVVKEQQLSKLDNKVRINTSNMNSGIYFYSINVNGYNYLTKKLIIK